jgi:FkbM family methyltransferase
MSAPYLVGSGLQIVTSVSGVKIAIDPCDYASCMMFFGRYSPDLLEVIRAIVRPGDSVVDVGAQLGYVTANLARWVGPSGTVHSFEPDPNALAQLNATIDANRSTCVKIFSSALGDREGEMIFYTSSTLGWSTAVANSHHRDLRPISVRTTRLDSLAASGKLRRPVRFVKIDVEGFECQVLDGMRELRASDSPYVLAEVNPLMLKPSGRTPRDVLERLAENGHEVFQVAESTAVLRGGQVRLRRVDTSAQLEFSDVLAVPPGQPLPSALIA